MAASRSIAYEVQARAIFAPIPKLILVQTGDTHMYSIEKKVPYANGVLLRTMKSWRYHS